jgi:hypothetical protein
LLVFFGFAFCLCFFVSLPRFFETFFGQVRVQLSDACCGARLMPAIILS